MSVKVLIRALIRWSWLLLLSLVIGYYGGKALAGALPPQYQATAIVQLNALSRTSSLIQPVGTYSSLVTADSILGAALKHFPKLNPQNISTKQLTITPGTLSGSITIQVTLPDNKAAAGLANMLARLLVQQENQVIKVEYAKSIQILQQRISTEQNYINGLNAQIIKLSPTTQQTQIQQLQSQVNQHQGLQTKDIDSLQKLQTEQALYSAPLTVSQTANVPNKPSSIIGEIPLAPLTLGIVFILGIVLASYLERRAGRINSILAVQQKVKLPILGSLDWAVPTPRTMPIRTFAESKSPYAEQCRIMMADILFNAEDANSRVLAIIATRLRAGTSSIAAELAALLAQSKRRVLLIDANLYQPSLHKRLEVANDAGLAKMLEEARMMKVGVTPGVGGAPEEVMNTIPVDSYIMSTGIPDLYLLPAGKPRVNPSSLLSMPEMAQFLKWAARRGDYIIIDCPALVHAEAHLIGALSDENYLVVDATRDRITQVMNKKEELISTGVKLSGLVVNKIGRWWPW